jgi:hypothetical protein
LELDKYELQGLVRNTKNLNSKNNLNYNKEKFHLYTCGFTLNILHIFTRTYKGIEITVYSYIYIYVYYIYYIYIIYIFIFMGKPCEPSISFTILFQDCLKITLHSILKNFSFSSNELTTCLNSPSLNIHYNLYKILSRHELSQTARANLIFRGPCIVIYLYSYTKTNEIHKFLKFILGIDLYIFWTVSLSIIRSLKL